MKTFKMPAGYYYIGDACYLLARDDYAKVLNDNYEFVCGKVRGRRVAIFETDHGDGTYYDNERRAYYVDAANIACVPVEIAKTDHDNLVNVVQFVKSFECYSENGFIRFGDIVINTSSGATL